MELEDLKKVWSDYDKKLTENLKTNNELIRKMNLNNAKSTMDTPKRIEIANVIFGFAFALYTLISTIKFSVDYRFLISGIFTSLWAVISLFLSVRLLNSVVKVDFHNDSIIKIQKQMIEYKKRFFSVKKYMLYTGPILAIACMPILVRAMTGIDIFELPVNYTVGVVIALIIGHPVAAWINKNWYEKKMIDTERFLEEINKFETEQ
jgi:hypothetical protein